MKKLMVVLVTLATLLSLSFAACGGTRDVGKDPTYTVTVSVDNAGYGTVSETKVTKVAKDTAITVDGATLRIGEKEITATPTASNAQYTYAFAGYSYTGDTVVGNMTVTARFTRTLNKYTVTFEMGDGEAISPMLVDYGAPVSELDEIEVVAPEHYHFVKWQLKVGDEYVDFVGNETLEGNITVKAVYEIDTFEIRFVNDDGTELQSEELAYGTMPEYKGESDPEKSSTAQYTYTFAGWDPEIVSVTGAATYTATYDATVNKYYVHFEMGGGSPIDSILVDYGTPVSELNKIEVVAPEHYHFVKWQLKVAENNYVDFVGTETLEGEITVKAVYEIDTFEIKFVNDDGTELQSGQVAYGALPVYTGETPTKEATASYIYEFAGWDREIETVTEAATYTATFEEIAIIEPQSELIVNKSVGSTADVSYLGLTSNVTGVRVNGEASDKITVSGNTMTVSDGILGENIKVIFETENEKVITTITVVTRNISTKAGLLAWASESTGWSDSNTTPLQYVILTDDIDCEGERYDIRYNAVFNGTFNGRGHTIHNFQRKWALFGRLITEGSRIENVAFVNFTCINDDQSVLAVMSKGVLSNIYLSGDMANQTTQALATTFVYGNDTTGSMTNIIANLYNSQLSDKPAISIYAEGIYENVFVVNDNYNGTKYQVTQNNFSETNVRVYDSIDDLNDDLSDIIAALGDVYTEYYTTYNGTIVFKTSVGKFTHFTDSYTEVSYREGDPDATLVPNFAVSRWELVGELADDEKITVSNGAITVLESGHVGETVTVNAYCVSKAFGSSEVLGASKTLTIGKDVVTVLPTSELIVDMSKDNTADITYLGLDSEVINVKISGATTSLITVADNIMNITGGLYGEDIEIAFETANEIVSTKITIVSLNIASNADLTYFKDNFSNVAGAPYVIMTADIDREGGSYYYSSVAENAGWFEGTFNGRGHVIYNAVFGRPLIAQIKGAAVIKNLAITQSSVDSVYPILPLKTRGLIENVYLEYDCTQFANSGTWCQPLTYEVDYRPAASCYGEMRNVIVHITNFTGSKKVCQYVEGPMTNVHVLIDGYTVTGENSDWGKVQANGSLTNCGLYSNETDFKATVNSSNQTVTDAFDTSNDGLWMFDANGMLVFKTADALASA